MGRFRNCIPILPAGLFVAVFMLVPLGYALSYSFLTAGTYGGVHLPATFEAYIQLLFQRDFDDTLHFSSNYLQILGRSLLLALLATIGCAVLGVPLAWYLATRPANIRRRLLFLVTLPFWVNSLIRTFCWVLLLRDQGLINHTLQNLGIIDQPLGLMYNNGAILLGLIYNFLPFMVLPIYAALEKVDAKVIDAGYDLYARRRHIFRDIIIPLAMPGVRAGSLMVFAPAIGYYIIPDLLGGGQYFMIGNLIQVQFTSGRNWPLGAALSTLLTLSILLILWAGTTSAKKRGKQ